MLEGESNRGHIDWPATGLRKGFVVMPRWLLRKAVGQQAGERAGLTQAELDLAGCWLERLVEEHPELFVRLLGSVSDRGLSADAGRSAIRVDSDEDQVNG